MKQNEQHEIQLLMQIHKRLFEDNNLIDISLFETVRSAPKSIMRDHYLELKSWIRSWLINYAEKFDPDYLKNNANARGCKSVEQYVKKQFYYNDWFCSPKVKKRRYFKEARVRLLTMRAWVQYDLQIVANKWYTKHQGEILKIATAAIAASNDAPKEGERCTLNV